MSGHSKWSQIKRQKGAADVKKGKTFTKLGNAITIAVKKGGGIADPAQNFRLRLAIEAAKNANMPKENIERAIKRAAGKDAGSFEEIIYEGFALGKASLIVQAATDNPTRTTAEIKSLFNKSGANFGQPGSVSYQFDQIGRVVVKKQNHSFEDVFNAAVEFGAEDIQDINDVVYIYTLTQDLFRIREDLSKKGFLIEDAEIIWKPKILISELDEERLAKVESFINALEDLDDVQKVYSNLEELQ